VGGISGVTEALLSRIWSGRRRVVSAHLCRGRISNFRSRRSIVLSNEDNSGSCKGATSTWSQSLRWKLV